MPLYTEQLKYVVEDLFGTTMDPDDWEQEYHSVSFDGIEYGKLPTVPDWTLLGLGTYPIFDESYREILNGKILDEYYNWEIGTETIDNWQLMVRKKMDQIMPFYNKLYESEKIKFDPLATYDLTTETESENQETSNTTGTATSNSTTKSDSRAVAQELPQVMLSGNGDYATSANDSTSNTKSDGTNSQDANTDSNTSGTGKSHTSGYQGVASELLMRYRNSIINIDLMIIAELADCFMLILNNGDSYTQSERYYF